MMRKAYAAALLITLAACGPGSQGSAGGRGAGASAAACQSIGDPAALFGANAVVTGYASSSGGAVPESCEITSADGAKAGEVVTIAGATAAQMQEITQKWATQTTTPLAAVDGLGEGAQMATDLPGYQTQIAFFKNNTIVLIQARTAELASGPSASLAKRMATTVAASMH